MRTGVWCTSFQSESGDMQRVGKTTVAILGLFVTAPSAWGRMWDEIIRPLIAADLLPHRT